MAKAQAFPGYSLAFLHLNVKDAGEKDRVVRIKKTADNILTKNYIERDVRDDLLIKFTDLENGISYDIYIIHKDENFQDYPNNKLTVTPQQSLLLPIRSDFPAADIKSFFTLMYNLVTTVRTDLVMSRHGPTLDFGDAEDGVKQLTPAQVQSLQSLERTLANGSLTAAENASYTSLKNIVTRGDTPVVIYRLVRRQLAGGNIPFGVDKALAPRTLTSGVNPITGEYEEEKAFFYDNEVELQIHAKDANVAEDLALFFEYLIEDYKDYFQRNGMHLVYFHSRNSDDFNEGKMDFYIRPLTFFVRTQRVIKQIPDIIRAVEVTATMEPLLINASILTQGTDFS